MNYGAEPADQVVRYSLEGMEYSLTSFKCNLNRLLNNNTRIRRT